MKLRSLILFGAGVTTGLAIAKKLSQDDDEIVHGPHRTASNENPGLRVVSATMMSLDAIRRARGAIRDRLGESVYDDAAWS
jgi:hypothetical protein